VISTALLSLDYALSLDVHIIVKKCWTLTGYQEKDGHAGKVNRLSGSDISYLEDLRALVAKKEHLVKGKGTFKSP